MSVAIGIGLPTMIRGTTGDVLLDWARRAEKRGFAALAVRDRVAYPSYDPLLVLAAAAAATTRIGLVTNILLAATRDPVHLAKATASLDELSGGRLTLGLAVGDRPDDFAASATAYNERGRRMDVTVDVLQRAWRGEEVGGSTRPVTPGRVRAREIPIMFGGSSQKTIERVVRWGAGWTMSPRHPESQAELLGRLRAAWSRDRRPGSPRIAAGIGYALGPSADEAAKQHLTDYLSYTGNDTFWQSTPRSVDAIQEAIERHVALGVGEIYFTPMSSDIDQIDLLADAVGPMASASRWASTS